MERIIHHLSAVNSKFTLLLRVNNNHALIKGLDNDKISTDPSCVWSESIAILNPNGPQITVPQERLTDPSVAKLSDFALFPHALLHLALLIC